MNQDELKHIVAQAALSFVEDNGIVGIGSGSTIHYFIEALAKIKHRIEAAVPSSQATRQQLKAYGIPILEFTYVSELSLYLDGADACNRQGQLVKGGGGALTQEKILASASTTFICLVDESKQVDILGEFPVAVEVIPMARSFVARKIVKLGGDPVYRENFITDNGNIILDVYNLTLTDPLKIERAINNIPGVVCNGIFADRITDRLLISTQQGVITIEP